MLKKDKLKEHPFLAKLGPDILSERPDTETLFTRLLSPAFANKQLAALLLDQGFVAGLGTYLCAEILSFAKLHPKTKPSNCSSNDIKRLAKTIVEITQQSYRTQAIINSPKLVYRLKPNDLLEKETHRFSVYLRGRQPCCRCSIERTIIGGHPMFYCPGCQTSC